MVPKNIQSILATILLLFLPLQSHCFTPLPCNRYTTIDDVMSGFAGAEVRHDTRSGARLRGAEWREAGSSGETGKVAELLEGADFYRVATPSGGFHRRVRSCVNAGGAVERECWVMVEEKVPRSLYVDVYAMEREEKEEEGRKYFFPEYMDVEAAEDESKDHSFLSFSPLNTSHPACHASTLVTWHLRYHRPSASGSNVLIDLPEPEVYLHCRPQEGETSNGVCASRKSETYAAPCPHANSPEVCEWAKVQVAFKGNPRFSAPVGDDWHEVAAVLVTLLVTVGGSFVMMRYLCGDEEEFCDGESPYDDAKIHDE